MKIFDVYSSLSSPQLEFRSRFRALRLQIPYLSSPREAHHTEIRRLIIRLFPQSPEAYTRKVLDAVDISYVFALHMLAALLKTSLIKLWNFKKNWQGPVLMSIDF
ncbi:MAG: hypothetical protein HOK17_02985 [Flammeovirgaceae bacterium]|jgi:hypothetical protein|nr:hypothetical protein [Flammeovirgaceae bacterium]